MMDQQYLYSKDFFSYYNFHSKDFLHERFMGIFLSFKNTNYKIPLQEDTKQGIQGFIFYPRARGRLSLNMPFTIIWTSFQYMYLQWWNKTLSLDKLETETLNLRYVFNTSWIAGYWTLQGWISHQQVRHGQCLLYFRISSS